MKLIYTFLATFIISASMMAQSPASFKYQAVLRDARGNVKANTATSIIISILQGSATGNAVYTETHFATTDGYGLINLEIGKGTVTLGTFSGINWGTSTYFIKVSVDGVEMGTSQLLSVPYALYAAKAGGGFSGSYADLLNKPTLTNGTVTIVTGTTPITVATGTTTPLISMAKASGISDGYLSSLDWTKFNNMSSFDGSWTSLIGKPTFATVAASGNYNDLLNKPAYSSKIADLDGNTNIMVEKNPNDDTIRFAVAGKERIKFDGKTLFWLNDEHNMFFGNNSGSKTTKGVDIDAGSITGFNNSFFGDYSGEGNTTGYRNTFIGTNTGLTNSTGFRNTIVGSIAGQTSNGSNNVFVGASAGWANGDGEKNVYIGSQAGANSGGSGNVFIGQKSGWVETTSNKLYISNSETTTPLIYGEFDNSLVTINGSFKATNGINANNKIITNVSTPINSSDAVNKAYVDAMKQEIKLEIYAENGVSDIDGNHYNAVKIGTQVWMAENLKTTKYRNGDLIGTTTPTTLDITSESTPKYHWAYNGNESNVLTYGRLYTWYAATDNRKICPVGWHVPSHTEWTTLTDFLEANGYGYGGSGIYIGKSMAATSGWNADPTTGNVGNDQATNNSSGFTALPGGSRSPNGIYYSIGNYGYWWSSYDALPEETSFREIFYNSNGFWSGNYNKRNGYSVRCLRD
jgi:uncharacterized protein (TIGR02145 family)